MGCQQLSRNIPYTCLTLVMFNLLGVFAVALALPEIILGAPQPYCKPIPGSSDWPAPSEWQKLNDTLQGRLVAPVPPGEVCQTSSASFSNETCGYVLSQWTNSTWHASNGFTSGYNDVTCLPDSRAPCSADGYPAYFVNATEAAHVQAGVEFAHRTGIRLIVKGTGHDYQGRSAARDAISIYTHNMKGVQVNQEDERATKYGGVASIKIAAGSVMKDIYGVAAMNNLTVVGGADANVGIGGWLTGGGHSPISSKYGLGVDQVLEIEAVIANGTLVTVNEHHNPDLFWALRGGGGSTFAVITSVTMLAFPSLPVITYEFAYNTTVNSNTYWDLVTYFHTQLPNLSDHGVMGYYWATPDASAAIGETDPAIQAKVFGAWFLPGDTFEDAHATLEEFEKNLKSKSQDWEDEVRISSLAAPPLDISTLLSLFSGGTVGSEVRLGSWLLGREALTNDTETLKTALQKTNTIPQDILLGHVVAGNGVKNATIVGGSNSVLPAWRNAITHVGKLRRNRQI
ncbi:hypothetical protein, variant [Exophiala mesophila]|uniref:FAD-binding PCMH-type domain-containing protein n=1 Tax=Exophiala mesophila TaxID=212818 RepID=A0A0D1ZEW7_EXOME|nr:hypothetical protein, variant [Exophiala mesophila]KIV93292.1 hypothetical protein, variant [Exophiala mesophila]